MAYEFPCTGFVDKCFRFLIHMKSKAKTGRFKREAKRKKKTRKKREAKYGNKKGKQKR